MCPRYCFYYNYKITKITVEGANTMFGNNWAACAYYLKELVFESTVSGPQQQEEGAAATDYGGTHPDWQIGSKVDASQRKIYVPYGTRGMYEGAPPVTGLLSGRGYTIVDPAFDGPVPTLPQEDGYLMLASGGQTPYRVVYGYRNTDNIKVFTSKLSELTSAEFLYTMGTVSEPVDYEIIVGEPALRQECADALTGVSNGYAVKVSGKKVVITGTDPAWTSLALDVFTKQILKNPSYASGTTLKMPLDFTSSENNDDAQLAARFLSQNRDFIFRADKLKGFLCDDTDYVVAQGAVSDGTSVYCVFTNAAKTHSKLQKYNLATKANEGTSEAFLSCHGNDMSYDPVRGRLLVTYCPAGTGDPADNCKYAELKAGTMEYVGEIVTDIKASALTYNASQDKYFALHTSDPFKILDNQLNLIREVERTDGGTMTTQGAGSDDSYIYWMMWTSPVTNSVVVYDWNGNYVRDVPIPTPPASTKTNLESESYFYAAGKYYGFFYYNRSTGAGVYTLYPVLNYEF